MSGIVTLGLIVFLLIFTFMGVCTIMQIDRWLTKRKLTDETLDKPQVVEYPWHDKTLLAPVVYGVTQWVDLSPHENIEAYLTSRKDDLKREVLNKVFNSSLVHFEVKCVPVGTFIKNTPTVRWRGEISATIYVLPVK